MQLQSGYRSTSHNTKSHAPCRTGVAGPPRCCCCRYTLTPILEPKFCRYTVELQAKSKPAQAELGSDWHAVHQVGTSQPS